MRCVVLYAATAVPVLPSEDRLGLAWFGLLPHPPPSGRPEDRREAGNGPAGPGSFATTTAVACSVARVLAFSFRAMPGRPPLSACFKITVHDQQGLGGRKYCRGCRVCLFAEGGRGCSTSTAVSVSLLVQTFR